MCMDKRPATDVFHDWALVGKDEGMERGHAASVSEMLSFISKQVEVSDKAFSAVDVGCGNGWVVRKLQSHDKCEYVMGIDGAEAMIVVFSMRFSVCVRSFMNVFAAD